MQRLFALMTALLPFMAASNARAASSELRATYETYAAGMNVAEVEAGFGRTRFGSPITPPGWLDFFIGGISSTK